MRFDRLFSRRDFGDVEILEADGVTSNGARNRRKAGNSETHDNEPTTCRNRRLKYPFYVQEKPRGVFVGSDLADLRTTVHMMT